MRCPYWWIFYKRELELLFTPPFHGKACSKSHRIDNMNNSLKPSARSLEKGGENERIVPLIKSGASPQFIVYLSNKKVCIYLSDEPPTTELVAGTFYVWQTPNHTHILYEKEQIIRQCYGGMKEKHGMETITLFHVGDSYEAYFEDAETISRIMEAPLFKMTAANIPAVRISDTAMEECRNRLLDAGHEVCVSEFRGASGRHILKIL